MEESFRVSSREHRAGGVVELAGQATLIRSS